MGFLKHFRACVDDCSDCKPSPCDPCCPEFTVEYRSLSATKTKCGYAEYGTPSFPPKIYRIRTLAGSMQIQFYSSGDSACGTCVEEVISNFSGYCQYATPACSLTEFGSVSQDLNSPCGSFASNETCGRCTLHSLSTCFFDTGDSCLMTVSSSPTVLTVAGTGLCCDGGTFYAKATGVVTETLSSEYTTSDLYADTASALSVAGWSSWSGTPTTALHSNSSDQLTNTLRSFEFRVNLSVAAPAGCKLEWDVFLNGSFYAHNCVDLTAGATSYTDFLGYPTTPGEEYSVGNFAITSGAC